MKSKKSVEVWVGIFIFLGLAALTMLAFQVSGTGIGSVPTYTIHAKFNNVGGLSVKAPVMIGGVKVGKVAQIGIDREDYTPLVDLEINETYNTLPLDTGASILTSGLLGAQFVGLSPGASDFYLEAGDEIEFTQSAIQLESLVSQFLFNQDKEESQ